ncbi:AraC family transcriptional regulator [Anaerolentibacter hominis]|uniref:AraC family transcriptional regulator n=1 Tax=Anaerolentibacter hominis TaxID=3079009 RepID=UPI0031B833EB
MEWTECISTAVSYIEEHITEDITIEDIAKQAMVSPFYFQKGFAMLCGFTVGEYMKKRRLTLAGSELISTDRRIIDIALTYGYDSPDSFTKAFTRFHGATPTSVRKGEAMIKSFASLKIKLILEGGYTMDYKIVQKDQFTVIGISKKLKYDEAESTIQNLWAEFNQTGQNSHISSMYGISIDEDMEGNEFEYLIGDNYDPAFDIPAGFMTRVIPAHTWAVFACKGAASRSLQDTHEKIFSEWLPGCKDYEIAAGYHIEMYNDPADYAKGVEDEAYYSEIWIPVRQK